MTCGDHLSAREGKAQRNSLGYVRSGPWAPFLTGPKSFPKKNFSQNLLKSWDVTHGGDDNHLDTAMDP
jgi:hypothetical protein